MTGMHPCLQIVDILISIFSFLRDQRDLAALASTCRIFNDLTTGLLWSNLPSLAPLVRCLPDQLWEERVEGKIKERGLRMPNLTKLVSFRAVFYSHGSTLKPACSVSYCKRTPVAADWALFSLRASHVKILNHNIRPTGTRYTKFTRTTLDVEIFRCLKNNAKTSRPEFSFLEGTR
jgi:hypothetical protein